MRNMWNVNVNECERTPKGQRSKWDLSGRLGPKAGRRGLSMVFGLGGQDSGEEHNRRIHLGHSALDSLDSLDISRHYNFFNWRIKAFRRPSGPVVFIYVEVRVSIGSSLAEVLYQHATASL